MQRPFRCPGSPWVPLLGIGSCAVIMPALPGISWLRFVVWLAMGLAIYLAYARRHSKPAAH